MNDQSLEKRQLNVKKQRILELERVEKFLRGEVRVLRNEILELRESLEYKLGTFIVKFMLLGKFRAIKNFFITKTKNKISSQSTPDSYSSAQIFSQSSHLNLASKIEILFVQLSNNKEIGGISQLNSIFEEAKAKDLRVYSIDLNYDFSIENANNDSLILKQSINKLKVNKVVFSGIESFEFISQYENLRSAKVINFLQGPDYLFPGNESKLSLFKESISQSSLVIAQSPYLNNLAKYMRAKNSKTITLGPKRKIFYDSKFTKEKILLISTRRDTDKGLRFALPVFESIQIQGWKVIGFGDLAATELAAEFDEHLGRIDHKSLAELYQRASLLLDLSSYEGLGLTAIEAGMCGVRSIVSKKGGIESLEKFKQELLIIDDPLNLDEIAQKILSFEPNLSDEARQKLVNSANEYSWESGINLILAEIENV